MKYWDLDGRKNKENITRKKGRDGYGSEDE